jgi:hypothetical protein
MLKVESALQWHDGVYLCPPTYNLINGLEIDIYFYRKINNRYSQFHTIFILTAKNIMI